MIKFIITVLILLALIILLKKNEFFFENPIQNIDSNYYGK